MFESQRDSIIQPKVGRASGLPWVNVRIIDNPEAGCIYFSERGCVQAHQPQHSGGPNASQTHNRCGWSCRHSRAPTKGPDTTPSELLFLFHATQSSSFLATLG